MSYPDKPRPAINQLGERIVSVCILLSLTAVWFIGEGQWQSTQQAVDGLRQPVGLGSFAIIAVLGMVGLNALFVAAETAVDILRPMHVRFVRETNDGQSQRLQALIDHRPRYVAACALGGNFVRIGLIFVAFLLGQNVALWAEKSLGWPFSYGSLLLAALCIALPVEIINLILGRLVPKSYATLHPHRVGLALYSFVRSTSAILSLIVWPVASVANVVTARFGGTASFTSASQTEEEIKNLVESAQETGEIEDDEKELLHSVFDFSDTVAREIMTPRVDLDSMPVEGDPSDAIRLIQKTGHSRIPLYDGTDDTIVGIIHAKDLLKAFFDGKTVTLRSLMRPPLVVPENKDLHELLQEMRQSRNQMAIIQDEFGGTAGIVTIEDIVEELVGEIVDEYDEVKEEFVETPDGVLVDGRTHWEDVRRYLGVQLDSDEFDTIGGYVFGLFGRQPKKGESIEADSLQYVVADTDGRRIQRLRIRKLAPSEPDEANLLNA